MFLTVVSNRPHATLTFSALDISADHQAILLGLIDRVNDSISSPSLFSKFLLRSPDPEL